MQDEAKTKEQLIIELRALRQRLAESKKDKTERKRCEEAQREAEEQLKFILDKVPALIWQKNQEGKYLLVNKAYCDTVGLSMETIVGKTDYDIFPAKIVHQYVSDDRTILRSGASVFDREEHYQKPSGELGWSRTDKMVHHDIDGHIAGTIGFALDITKRKEAEAVLRESEERFRQLAENINQVFWITDVDITEILYVSAAYEEIWGRTCASLYASPKSWFDCVHPEDLCLVTNNLAKRGSGAHSSEYRIVRPDGSIRWILERGFPVLDETGEVYRFAGIAEDITDRKQAEEALRESEERYRQVVENVNEAIIVAQDGRLKFVNCVASEIFGYPEGELLSRPFVDFIHRDDRSMVMDSHLRRLRGETLAARYPFRLVGKDGGARWVQIGAVLIEWEGRAATLDLLTDITERKRAEEERARLEAENRQLQKAESLGRMAGAIAHLFNNHLAVVTGNLELALMDLSGDAEIRKSLIEAMRAARRSSEISGLMLTYLGQTTDQGEPLDLSDVCRHNLPMFRDVMPEGITLEVDLLSSGPVVRANPKQVHQVLTHLIANGWESMGHSAGTVTLATRIIPASEIPKFHLAPIAWKPAEDLLSCLEVTDTGCGMAEEDLDKIFDPFYTTKFTGRGLGLAVVLGIVKTWGGAIGVESRKNQGSSFCVFLPLVTDELSRAPEKAAEVQQMEQGGAVLLVEDQDMVRKMAELMLKRLGYEVLAASDGPEAVELLRDNPDLIRCVITDLSMPGMDGWETLTALRKIRPHIPVVLVSGHDEAHAMGRGYAEQPQVFLHKPYLKNDLEAAIDTALKKPVSTI